MQFSVTGNFCMMDATLHWTREICIGEGLPINYDTGFPDIFNGFLLKLLSREVKKSMNPQNLQITPQHKIKNNI